jgi:hypothetical protein
MSYSEYRITIYLWYTRRRCGSPEKPNGQPGRPSATRTAPAHFLSPESRAKIGIVKWLAATLALLCALTAHSQDRATAVANLEKCIRDVSTEARNCGGQPFEKVVALYSAGDLSLLPLLLRAHAVRYSGTNTDPGKVYLEIFEKSPEQFLSAAKELPTDDRTGVFAAFSSAVGQIPKKELDEIRATLVSVSSATDVEITKRLLYQVELTNAYRLKQYFPPGTFGGDFEGSDLFAQQWYSGNLFALGESPLFSELVPPRNAIYRFLWLRSFHNPVSVRLHVFPDGRGIGVLKVSDGAAGFHPGTLVRDKEFQLNAADTSAFLDLLSRAHFWKEPTHASSAPGDDGAQWMVEGKTDARYHVVDRWSPTSGPFRDAALFLLKKSGYVVAQEDIY